MDAVVIEWLVNFGVAGIVIILLLTGLLVTGREHARLEKENGHLQDALTLERQRNNDLLSWAAIGANAMRAVSTVAKETANDSSDERTVSGSG